jgi:uncharacterized protein YprB with RNaseH-like and TPR domain
MKWKDKLSRLSMPGKRGTTVDTLEGERVEREPELSLDTSPFPASRSPSAISLGALDHQARLSRLRAELTDMQQRAERKLARVPPPTPRVEQASAARSRPGRAGGPLPGEHHDSPHGRLRRVVTRLEEDHKHGATPVVSALDAVAADVALLALDPALASVDLSRALYIDTETTGLAGGSGTLPFLLGMAWFEGRQLVVEQLLLEKPGLEGPMLARMAELLAEASCVVSYNGKSFDWPLLRTRFVLNRVKAPPLAAHLDLLHCARRVYKRRLGAVRLVHLEEAVLGLTREGDIPGELIPETYLGFLRGHVPGAALAPIVEHNHLDLVALAAMLGELSRRFRGPGGLPAHPLDPAGDGQSQQDARDQLGFATVAARADDHERALSFAHAAAAADIRGELAPEAHFLAGDVKLRRGDVGGAASAYRQSLEASVPGTLAAARAHLALAKLYEHRLKRPDLALAHAAQTHPAEDTEASARRVERLRKRKAPALGLFPEL